MIDQANGPVSDLMEGNGFYNNPSNPNRSSASPLSAPKQGIVRRIVSAVSSLLSRAPKTDPFLFVPPPGENSQTGVADVSVTSYADNLWRIQAGRTAAYRDLMDMDQNDTIISTALDIIADCATGHEDVEVDGFEWEFEKKNAKAATILKELYDRLNLGMEAWHVVRGFVKFGEEYREIIVDNDMIIRKYLSLPSYTIYPKIDERGNKVPGWYQQTSPSTPSKRVDFEEWQISDFIYGARQGHFGTGLLYPARRTWRRLEKVQDGMAIARLIRAYDKFEHKVPVRADWDQKKQYEAIARYRNQMTRQEAVDSNGNTVLRQKPLTVETDIYVPDDGSGRGGVTLLNAQNNQLMHIDDVEYFQSLLLARIKVPRKFLNLSSGRGSRGGGSTDSSLAAEDIQFARTLRYVQSVLRQGYLHLGWLALFFQGYDANSIGLRVRMPKISTMDALMDAKILFTKAQAAEIIVGILGGIPPELLASKYMELDLDEKDMLTVFLDEMETAEEGNPETANPSSNGASSNGVASNGASSNGVASKNGQQTKVGADGAARSTQALRRMQRRGIAKRAGRQLGERIVPRTQDQEGAVITPEDLAKVLTQLEISCKSEEEKLGEKFGIGYSERLDANREFILDVLSSPA